MQTQVVRFENLDFKLKFCAGMAQFDATWQEAFADADRDLLMGAMHATFAAINWTWACWVSGGDFSEITRRLRQVVLRGIELAQRQAYEGPYTYRPTHDLFLMHCAIFSGNAELMRAAAEATLEAKAESPAYQYDSAWAGILKFRVLGDQSSVRRQYEILQRYKPMRIFPWPGKKCLAAFVAKDYKTLATAVRSDARKHWRYAEDGVRQDDGGLVIDVKKKQLHFLWPFVEAAFAKLALMDGASIKHDDVWFPLELVRKMA